MSIDPKNDVGESFLSRWSRLKRTDPTAQSEPVPEPPAPATAEAAESVEAASPAEPAPPDTPLDLPDVETLNRDSDYKPFLAADVPTALRNAALRKLWRSDPVFANLDGLNDYDGDFTIAANVVEVAVEAAEKVVNSGRRMADHVAPAAPPPTAPPHEAPEGGAAATGKAVAMAEAPVDGPTPGEPAVIRPDAVG